MTNASGNRRDAGRDSANPATISADEALALLGPGSISRRAFYQGVNRGQVPHVRVGRRILIPRAKFLRWAGLDQPEGGPQA